MKLKPDFSRTNSPFFGHFGMRVLTGTSVPGECFYCILVINNAVISADILTDPEVDGVYKGDTELTALAVEAGFYLFGKFTNVDLTSGKIIGYLM